MDQRFDTVQQLASWLRAEKGPKPLQSEHLVT
jgi:hypothetical protein